MILRQPEKFFFGDTAQLYYHTVPIFDCDRGISSPEGSGVFIVVQGRKFIITAAHVLEKSFEKIGFGYLTKGGFRLFGSSDMKVLATRAQSGAGNPRDASYRHGIDLAILEPTAEVLATMELHYKPFDFEQSSYNPTCPWGVLSGWPARKNRYSTRSRTCDFETCYHVQCPILSKDETSSLQWNADIFIALSVDKEKHFADLSGKKIHLPKLNGMSGGGFWVPAPSNGGWALSGIVLEDDAPRRALKVLKVQYVGQALERFDRLTQ